MSQTPTSTNARSTTEFKPGGKSGESKRPPDWRHMSKLFEQLPPHAIEAEMCVLGSMMLDPNVIGDVILTLRGPDDFSRAAHGSIYKAMVELYDKHAQLDIVQLHQMLVDRDIIESVGGQTYLVELADSVPTAANATYYARLVREKAMVRDLIEAAGDILYDAYNSPDTVRNILDAAEQKIFHIAQSSEQTSAEALHDLIQQTMHVLESNDGRSITGVASGFAELDEMTTGLQSGEMIILAARPSMGKTALALNVTEQIAMQGKPVAVFSLEMGKQQLVQRLLCARSGVDSQRLRRNMLTEREWERLVHACDQLMQAPIYIDDTPGLTALQMRAKSRRLVAKHQVEAIVIDYMQLMSSGARVESRQQEVSEISRSVKAMARELNVPVICLSQLNRAAEQREGHRPRMSDLRESGSIEQDADVIMMLHREEYYNRSDPDWADDHPEKVGVAELILAKQRNGPTGTIRLTWDESSTRFKDYTAETPPPGYESRGKSDAGQSPYADAGGAQSSQPRGAFAAGPGTGPVSNFRDGGGPTAGSDGDDGEEDIGIPY